VEGSEKIRVGAAGNPAHKNRMEWPGKKALVKRRTGGQIRQAAPQTRICSNRSTFFLLSNRSPLGRLSKTEYPVNVLNRMEPIQVIRWGQFRLANHLFCGCVANSLDQTDQAFLVFVQPPLFMQ
jgi:hypothetical protein